MALDWTKDIDSLQASDVEALTADEKKILGRFAVSKTIRGTSPFDPTGVEMAYGSTQRGRILAADVAFALLKGWVKV